MLFYLYMTGTRGVNVPGRCVGEGRFVRQMGPPGRYGVIDLVLEPGEESYGPCVLSWEVSESQIPLIFLDGVISAIKHVMTEDEFAGDHLSNTVIRVVGGAYHQTDSKLSCYAMATALALRAALTNAGLYGPALAAQAGDAPV
ncbi:hypothetical protein [Duganella sp. Root1480D1]|uniref:hypothetical protein n=1 Tax=Duganella sp. Root1480D1 TaxID=1736471 RepID=UPI00070F9D5F|nr:hypothetical protein [Duganella sp. Root1480D1]KQZ34141.1 hypothetical protein ASD58_29075 [Duganella sp. Root1480D1]